jgi:hypothetical protein
VVESASEDGVVFERNGERRSIPHDLAGKIWVTNPAEGADA